MIDERDKIILRDVARIAEAEGIDLFVIGAGARFLVHDWPRGVARGRGTTDWDIAVRVSSWAEFERLKTSLCAGPFRRTAADHRLTHAGGRNLDVVPFGGVEAEDRTVTYPQGRTTHSVLGLRECQACCTEVDVGDGVTVRAVGLPGLTLLKAKAYLDRRPGQTHDLQDLDFGVDTYAHTLDDGAVFEHAAEVLQGGDVLYEDVGAYLLAREVRALGMNRAVMQPLLQLIDELTEPDGRAVDDLLRGAPHDQVARRLEIARRYLAFRTGLSA
jgi:predicted nucleotidyltransferase